MLMFIFLELGIFYWFDWLFMLLCIWNIKNRRENFNRIPRFGESFSVVASEIYYDKTKLQKVYNYDTLDEEVDTNGIKCAYVEYRSVIMTFDELMRYNRFIGNEFCITDKNQILPLYGITFRRIKYLVIWRDYNFNSENPNHYNDNDFQKIQEFHREIKKNSIKRIRFKNILYTNYRKSNKLNKKEKI